MKLAVLIPSCPRFPRSGFLSAAMTIAALLLIVTKSDWRVNGQGGLGPVATVSAASFFPNGSVAPGSIVAAFGTKLATQTVAAQSQPLPTQLAGTTVRVNSQLAPLFFVSPNQVNLIIPSSTALGMATVLITSGDGTMSQGTVLITAAAPGIFTANADGQGAPAALALRVKANGMQIYEPVARFDGTKFVPLPIDLGPEGERVFLILFLSAVRGAADPNGDGNVKENVHLLMGGTEVTPDYAGQQGGFAGLDQMNAEIPRTLIGRGRVSLAVTAIDFSTSNVAEIEIAARPGPAPPQISSYNPPAVLAGNTMTIAGSGFAVSPGDNLVRIGGIEATIVAASANQLSVKVPYGAETGPVTVRTLQGEGASPTAVSVRTSISGFVEDTSRHPIPDVTVKTRGSNITATTDGEGTFTMPDVAAVSPTVVDVNPASSSSSLPYPTISLKINVQPNRDNLIERPVSLEAVTGPSVTVGTGPTTGFSAAVEKTDAAIEEIAAAPTVPIQTGGVTFDVPDNIAAQFPDGRTRGALTLNVIKDSRTPVNLPAGVFSSTIAQITPFRVKLNPGGKLTFPNREGFSPGRQVRLYKFDQTTNSPTIGSFVDVGAAIVSANGQTIETAAGAITETSYYFVAVPSTTLTTVIGRVLESDGATPLRRALVRARGQEAFTDGFGGFILSNAPVSRGDLISVEASVLRPNGHIDRAQKSGIPVVVSGITNAGNIVLPSTPNNQPPILTALPSNLTVTENTESLIDFRAFDPDPGQTVSVKVSGADFVTIRPRGNILYTLAATPKTNHAGRYTITITATDNLGAETAFSFTLIVNRPPVANPQTVTTGRDVAKAITLTGDDADNSPINFLIVTTPTKGRLSGAAPNLIYTPNTGFTGTDQFTFKVNDGYADSNTATVGIVVNPPGNRPPVLTVPGAQTVPFGQNLSFTITAADPDAGQILAFTASGLPNGATLVQPSGASARFSWTPSRAQIGQFTVSFKVSDNGSPSLSDAKDVLITVTVQ